MNRTGTAYVGNYTDPTTPTQSGLYRADGTFVRWIEENALDADHPFCALCLAPAGRPSSARCESHGETLVWQMTTPAGFRSVEDLSGGDAGLWRTRAPAGCRSGWQPATNQLLTEAGYIVFRLDNRGEGDRSARVQGRRSICSMGQPEIEDQVLAANYLRSLPYVDDARIAMMGWSYGGFMSLMAITEPDMGLAAAAVGAPPTDWSLYDTHYTERFMSTPEDEPGGLCRRRRHSAPATT